MSDPRSFDWWLDHVDVAEWKDERDGQRDAMASCPAHGGSDSLHLTEKNGKGLVRCFACSAPYDELVAAAEAGRPETADVPVARVTRKRARVASGPPGATVSDPLAWYAAYCGTTRAWLLRNFRVSATPDGWIAHGWDGTDVTKDREPIGNDAGRRQTPAKADRPDLWPALPDSLGEEFWLCEGESDVVALKLCGIDAYTLGGASTEFPAETMKSLVRRGAKRMVLAYDRDKAGRQGAKKVTDESKKAGLGVLRAWPSDPLVVGPKDWRERVVSGDTSRPEPAHSEELDEIRPLADVVSAEAVKYLIGKIHPDGHTILFGAGGTGKGMIAADWVVKFVEEEDIDVLVVDYEQNATHEWRPRVQSLASEPETLKRVHIWQPTQAIWDVAGELREAVLSLGIGCVVVDSLMYACAGAKVEESGTVAAYSLAIAQCPSPVLSLAHTTKEDDPRYPFGSVFWNNDARVTVSVENTGAPGELGKPRRLNVRKANQGVPFLPEQVDWSWETMPGLPAHLNLEYSSATKSNLERVADAVRSLGGTAFGPSDIVDITDKDGYGHIDAGAVSRALQAMKPGQLVVMLNGGRKWQQGKGMK